MDKTPASAPRLPRAYPNTAYLDLQVIFETDYMLAPGQVQVLARKLSEAARSKDVRDIGIKAIEWQNYKPSGNAAWLLGLSSWVHRRRVKKFTKKWRTLVREKKKATQVTPDDGTLRRVKRDADEASLSGRNTPHKRQAVSGGLREEDSDPLTPSPSCPRTP